MLGVKFAVRGEERTVADSPTGFAELLRKLRATAGLTQEELAGEAGLSSRAIGGLERGVVSVPQRETVRLLADALRLNGPDRAQFEMAARGHPWAVRNGSSKVAAATRTLPSDIASFTGRQDELRELLDATAGRATSVHVIGGMAGIGKTAFAVHAGHRLADRFPDGQIFLSLHGHTPGQQPVGAAGALASLLLTLGIPAAQVPADFEGRIGLWRDRLAERQLLLILDDAVSSEQVRPLLPGVGGSMVLVTSRRRLSALEDARTISLGTLSPEDAAGLLVRLAVRTGLSSADPAVAEIARLCGFLPLAIGMAGRQLYHHPAWTPAGRATELADAVDRLGLLVTENVSVAAAFDLSYADLNASQQRLFRRLGLHIGTDIDAYAAAALDGTDLAASRHGLEFLYDQYLLAEPSPGRYRMHDLVREHAQRLADRFDRDSDCEQATERLLDYYQHAAARANGLVARRARPASTPPVRTLPTAVPLLTAREQALAWTRAERVSLLACLDRATETGQLARVVALTAGLTGLLRHDGPWAEAITRHVTAVRAAVHVGDQHGQAEALNDLGDVRRLTGDHVGATRDLAEALGIYRDLGDRYGQANALTGLGAVRRLTGDNPGATRDLAEALSIYRDLGDRLGQANALTGLGIVRRLTGENPGATRDLAEALGIYVDLGDRYGQANALTFLGSVRLEEGDYQSAARDLAKALGIARDSGDRYGQASALTFLGSVRRATGDYAAAARDLEEALAIARDIDAHLSEIQALNEVGLLQAARGDLHQAESSHQEALDLARLTGNSWGEACALAGLGRCALTGGHAAEAEAGLRRALEIFQRLGTAEAGNLAAELDALSGQLSGQGHAGHRAK